jgi:hypothetical protein
MRAGNAIIKGQLDEMAKQTKTTQDQLAAMRAQNAAMVDQNQIANKQLQQMVIDKRPWIAVSSPELSEPADGKTQRSLTVQLTNYGSTPGTIVQVSSEFAVFHIPTRRSKPDPELPDLVEVGIPRLDIDMVIKKLAAMPNQIPTSSVIPPGETAPAPQFIPATEEKIAAKLFGENAGSATMLFCLIVYTDTVGDSHQTLSSYFYDSRAKQLLPSPRWNRMN